ncbi:MAG: energy-coupling factor ABC transporter ATP-binding protein [Candidatus Omnitrophica bacterium]|nr:energy-coupling factor ABC transporter ATP-binding protein [Candidatus Omnitrophota bacterium]MBU4589660.1 energy-coupling factor ABC transporter ATP-binding protein [Candidatus Omnitrophota bacterium]
MEKIIEIKNLSYSYPDGTAALDNVNLSVFMGDCVGILGPNGAGKTTLLLHLNGILNGNSSVKIGGLTVDEKNLSVIRSKVGLVFQDPDDQLFMPTVFDDVAFGPVNMDMGTGEVQKRVDGALDSVDMKEYKERISHHLSYGEKKRISLATVLSMNPEILVLDEPTGNLDPKHRKEFIKFLSATDITKIIASHDIDMVKSICNKVAIMDKGSIAAFDTKENIFKNKDLLKLHSLY